MVINLRVFGHEVVAITYTRNERAAAPASDDAAPSESTSGNGSGLGGHFERAAVRHVGFQG